MTEPIKAGDPCEVVQGLGRAKSPNIGLKVIAESLRGDHSQHGRVWRCKGAGVKQLGDGGSYIETGWADFPASWLKKLPPDPQAPKATTTDREVTA